MYSICGDLFKSSRLIQDRINQQYAINQALKENELYARFESNIQTNS